MLLFVLTDYFVNGGITREIFGRPGVCFAGLPERFCDFTAAVLNCSPDRTFQSGSQIICAPERIRLRAQGSVADRQDSGDRFVLWPHDLELRLRCHRSRLTDPRQRGDRLVDVASARRSKAEMIDDQDERISVAVLQLGRLLALLDETADGLFPEAEQ